MSAVEVQTVVESNYSVPEAVQIKLKSLLAQKRHRNGIWGSKLQKEYMNLFHMNITFEEYGFGSLEHMFSKLTHVIRVVKHFKGDFKIFPANTMLGAMMHFPHADIKLQGVMQYGNVIPRQYVYDMNNLLNIKISHIYDPSKFWFYLAEDEKQLFDMMKKLQVFYGLLSHHYLIPSYQIRKNLYCVALYDNAYHRSKIIDVLPELMHSIKVFFIDYGTVTTVFVNNVYFLHKSFNELNAMAMKGQIALAKPCGWNMPWSKDTVALFENLVTGKCLNAQVESSTKCNAKDADLVYDLHLYDRTLPHHQCASCIKDQLIKQGLAIGVDQEQDKSQSNEKFLNNTQAMHLVPTFEDLESGLAPTREELKLLQDIYPAHKILQKYINKPMF